MTRKFFKDHPVNIYRVIFPVVRRFAARYTKRPLCNFMQNAVEYLFPCLPVQFSTYSVFIVCHGMYVSKLFKRSQVDEPFSLSLSTVFFTNSNTNLVEKGANACSVHRLYTISA